MKKIVRQRVYVALLLIPVCGMLFPLKAQKHSYNELRATADSTAQHNKKAWEIGIGGSMINWNRVEVTGFKSTQDNYFYNLKTNHLMGGVNLYVARELNPWFYLDLQGDLGMAKNKFRDATNDKKYNFLYMGGLGLQCRLSPLFNSKYVEPYLRAGVYYLHKDFQTTYKGNFAGDPTGEAHWESTDTWNPSGRSRDKNSFLPLSLGAGINAWLNNSLGLGLQGEYLMPLQKDLPRFVQVSARVMWRIGGKSKRTAPVIQYVEVEKPVERIVEKIVEKRVEVPSTDDREMYSLLDNVHFDFDKDVITPESVKVIDKLAALLKKYSDGRFLITGYTDAKGSDSYNLDLSRRRAKAVYNELLKRDVPRNMLKWRGVGKRASLISASERNLVREGDRKVLLEKVTNRQYWDALGE